MHCLLLVLRVIKKQAPLHDHHQCGWSAVGDKTLLLIFKPANRPQTKDDEKLLNLATISQGMQAE
jgi:hypothetical protein